MPTISEPGGGQVASATGDPTLQKERADVWSEIEPFWCGSRLATLGTQNLVWGQPQGPPPVATSGAVATAQFRPLTPADIQDALAQVRAATAAVDQRFVTAGSSADGWKAYLSWDQFKGELKKTKPDDAVLKKVSMTSWLRAMKVWS